MRVETLNQVYELGISDKRVVFVGSDLGPDAGGRFRELCPDRFFMEGISEQHVVGFCAGLAMEGFVPYVNTIGTFLTRRCYEQIAVDLCLQNLPVRLIAFGGGLTYAPLGPTHQAIEDIALMRILPNMTVIAPCDANEACTLLRQTVDLPGPVYFRLSKGGEQILTTPDARVGIGKGRILRDSDGLLFVTTGVMAQEALKASDILASQGIRSGVAHAATIKPLDLNGLGPMLTYCELLIVVEEHLKCGGLAGAILEAMAGAGMGIPPFLSLGIPDVFSDRYGTHESLLGHFGLDGEGIARQVFQRLQG